MFAQVERLSFEFIRLAFVRKDSLALLIAFILTFIRTSRFEFIKAGFELLLPFATNFITRQGHQQQAFIIRQGRQAIDLPLFTIDFSILEAFILVQ